ncbi:hypothetical protein I79_015055 [Cricetulus griseus]|uniref:Uncharacterized protein n=1 Tax=Cricetulus griseus TaxID=10029 RepID=G3HVR4_CRIGR|nr:hypothetical protein I79_015055 [Cricetulus griseus]ERE86259.1 hypothetical protein H671_2g4616 [Cricetulus griseus]
MVKRVLAPIRSPDLALLLCHERQGTFICTYKRYKMYRKRIIPWQMVQLANALQGCVAAPMPETSRGVLTAQRFRCWLNSFPNSLSSCPLAFRPGLDFVCPQLSTMRGHFAEEPTDTKVDLFRALSEWWYSTLTTWALLRKQRHSIIASFPRQLSSNPSSS